MPESPDHPLGRLPSGKCPGSKCVPGFIHSSEWESALLHCLHPLPAQRILYAGPSLGVQKDVFAFKMSRPGLLVVKNLPHGRSDLNGTIAFLGFKIAFFHISHSAQFDVNKPGIYGRPFEGYLLRRFQSCLNRKLKIRSP